MSDAVGYVEAAGPPANTIFVGATTEAKVISEDALDEAARKMDSGDVAVLDGSFGSGAGIVGEVVWADTDPEYGLVYGLEIYDEDIVRKIEGGLVEPAPSIRHEPVDEIDTYYYSPERDMEALVLEKVDVDSIKVFASTVDAVEGVLHVDRDEGPVPMSEYRSRRSNASEDI